MSVNMTPQREWGTAEISFSNGNFVWFAESLKFEPRTPEGLIGEILLKGLREKCREVINSRSETYDSYIVDKCVEVLGAFRHLNDNEIIVWA